MTGSHFVLPSTMQDKRRFLTNAVPGKETNSLKLLLDQRGTAQRLAGRLCQLFLGEGAAQPADIDALADGLRTHDLDIDWATETILRSELFFADQNIRQRVADPAECIIGATRA